MIIFVSMVLIITALLNLFAFRRRQERLQIFTKITPKNASLSSLLESQLSRDKQGFIASILESYKLMVQTNYDILLLGYSKLQLIGYIFIGVFGAVIFNSYYIGISAYSVIVISFIGSIVVIIYIKKRKLKKEFYETFPEALSTVIGVVSSGHAVTTSFKTCGDSIDGIVGKTMKEIHNRIEVGENAANVLLSSYRRLPLPEYYFFILTIMVNLDSGGELKEVLSRLTKMLANNRILAKTRDSKTSELRMTVLILSCIPFGFILVLRFVSPVHYSYLFESSTGHNILYYVVGSVAIGVLFIRNMISKVV